jgi:hypothetical protein
VGNDGETLVADSSTSTGLRYQGNYAAGKNEIINGDFSIWQRGTSFSNPTAGTFVADRYYIDYAGTIGTTTISQQTTPSVIATGVNTSSFLRWSSTVAGTSQSYNVLSQKIENVSTFADQTVTFSFYAKASASTALSQVYLHQNFGSGGSSEIYYDLGGATITTSWARYSFTVALGSLSGKTIGAGSYLRAFIGAPLNTTFTIDTWGWQVEASNTATAFQTATGTIQGELAACQRYYWRFTNTTVNPSYLGIGTYYSSTSCYMVLQWPVQMRVAPTVASNSATAWLTQAGVQRTSTAFAVDVASTNYADIYITTSSATAGIGAVFGLLGSSNNWVEASAEL